MSGGTPQISVLLPVHNGMPWLEETVASLRRQTFADFEIIAVDDGSTDGTADYLRSVHDARVRYHRVEKGGIVGALNFGMAQARGPVIARIDADDIAFADRLARQHRYLTEHPACVLLGCDFVQIDSAGQRMGEDDPLMTTDAALRWQLRFETPFLHPGVVFRKEAAQRVGGYREIYDVAEDYDMWVRLARVGRLANLPDRLMRKRSHPSAVSKIHRQRGLAQSSEIAADYARYLGAPFDPIVAGEMYWFYATGRTPTRCSLRDLAADFRAAQQVFAAPDAADCAELPRAIRAAKTRLRRLCLTHLTRAWFLPSQAIRWVRAMKDFDPEQGRLRDLLGRAGRRMTGPLRGPGRAADTPAAASDQLAMTNEQRV